MLVTTAHLMRLIDKHPVLTGCLPQLNAAYDLLTATFEDGGKLLVCGNGGSAADSEHIVGELMKMFLLPRPLPERTRQRLIDVHGRSGARLADRLQGVLPAISLVSQTSLMTAYANDVDADMIFAQQVYGYGEPGDALLCISTSGNSMNVLNAASVAQALGLRTLGLTGQHGGQLAGLCNVTIRTPSVIVTDIQEYHVAVYHALCAALEERFFG